MRDRPDCHSNPLLPSKLPKVAIPSYLHPISPAVGEMDKKKEKGGCQLKPADLPMHRGAVPRVVFLPPRGISLSWPLTPPIPKRNPNRTFSPHAAHLFFLLSGARCRLDICTSKGGWGKGGCGPWSPAQLEAEKGANYIDYVHASKATDNTLSASSHHPPIPRIP